VIDLVNLGGIAVTKLPMELQHVRNIEEFDGALLSEFKSATGETYLYYWCDCDDGANRWLVVRTPPQLLFRYLVGRTALRSLIADCVDGFAYVLDIGPKNERRGCWYIYAGLLPEEYVPAPDSHRGRDQQATQEGFQDVYMDQKWDSLAIAEYPKKYLQVYAFHGVFGPGGDPRRLSLHYDMTTGWVFHNLYELMRVHTLAPKRAELAAIGSASPGYLRFSVDQAIAAGVREAVARYIGSRLRVDRETEALREWSNQKGEWTHDDAKSTIKTVCESLGIDSVALLGQVNTLQATAKILVSYIGRLRFLANNDEKEKAMLVGLKPVAIGEDRPFDDEPIKPSKIQLKVKKRRHPK
jgi:hypothetical protein